MYVCVCVCVCVCVRAWEVVIKVFSERKDHQDAVHVFLSEYMLV